MAHTPSEPHPEDSRKPDSPTELTKPSWKYVLRSTIREVGDDGLTDLAAGLTYYTVLSIFPGLIALVSILSLFGQSADAVTGILDQVATVVPASTMDTIRPVLEGLLTAPAPGLGLIIGILTALWSASNYVKAFGRAMNVVYEVPEGRTIPAGMPHLRHFLTGSIDYRPQGSEVPLGDGVRHPASPVVA